MLESKALPLVYLTLIASLSWLSGCATTTPVRHLSSDVCLVLPESTTKTDVLSFMGEPDKKTSNDGTDETWIYYQKNEELIRKLPLLGNKFGSLNYEVVTVSFTGNLVSTCIYRQLEENDFNSSNDVSLTPSPK